VEGESNVRKIDKVILHCSASDNCDQTAAMIDSWHKERGFAKIGYHYFIRSSGMLEKGREDEEVGAHCEGYNATSIGICMAGLYVHNFTTAQFATLTALLKDLRLRYPKATLHGHTEFNVHKTCPVFSYYDLVTAWNQGFQELPKEEPKKENKLWNIFMMLLKLLKRS